MMQEPLVAPSLNGSSNGYGSLTATQGVPKTPSYKPEEIIAMVDQHERDIEPLRQRMEKDYSLYRLDKHVILDSVTQQPLTKYAIYTSSEPRSYANKIISLIAQAKLLIRVKHINDRTHQSTLDNLKENVAYGFLNAADERLVRMVHPKLRGALSFYVTVRAGVVAGRCLLCKHPDGSTYADITPWDPINTHYGLGPNGLAWACYKVKKTRQQIKNEHGVTLDDSPDDRIGTTDAEQQGQWVYDFYDDTYNTVLVEGKVLKEPSRHGSPRVPVYLALVGATPQVHPINTTGVVADIGESIYESVRRIYSMYNDIMSIMLELGQRARRQGLKVRSRDGKKQLPEDPYVEGTELSLAEGEDVEPLGLLEMAKETATFMGLLSGEIQRGSLPHSAWGELAFQLSGYAVSQLRMTQETVLFSRLEALQTIYLQIVNLLYDQYRTGYFDAMELSGSRDNRKYFSATITPEQLDGSCNYTVELLSQLPQDEVAKYTMANMARTGPTPLFSDDWIRENVLGIQDSEEAANQVKLQLSEHQLPEVGIYSLMKAAEEQNRPDIARYYYMALRGFLEARMGLAPQGMSPTSEGPGEDDATPGASPTVRPQAALGTPPSPATSNNGPSFIAPGTPRSGR